MTKDSKTSKRKRGASSAPSPGSEIPAQELANLCSVWRGHSAQCDGDMRLALLSCALDLDRLRDSYCYPVPFLYPLFALMAEDHGLILLASEMEDIRDVCRKLERVAPPNVPSSATAGPKTR